MVFRSAAAGLVPVVTTERSRSNGGSWRQPNAAPYSPRTKVPSMAQIRSELAVIAGGGSEWDRWDGYRQLYDLSDQKALSTSIIPILSRWVQICFIYAPLTP